MHRVYICNVAVKQLAKVMITCGICAIVMRNKMFNAKYKPNQTTRSSSVGSFHSAQKFTQHQMQCMH